MNNVKRRDVYQVFLKKKWIFEKKYSKMCEYVIFFYYFCRCYCKDAVCGIKYRESNKYKLLKNVNKI